MSGLSWRFRGENPDGGRDFGNANVWAFDPTLDVFTREVCQNTLDVREGPTVSIDFGLYRLRGDDLAAFLSAVSWDALAPHLEASADPEQKFGRELRQGLDHLADNGEMVVLRITERQARGLLGAEKGVNSNFAALCRNNLDSNKSSNAGGAFGLGKAVLWRCSSLSTVLFHSDLAEPLEGDEQRQNGRLFGRCELAWHEIAPAEFAGPGWFGDIDGQGQAVSAWNAGSAGAAMLMDRAGAGTGTSILVVGFHDPSREGQESVEDMAGHLARAVCKHFWPALHDGKLEATVGYWAGGSSGQRTEVPVLPSKVVGPFVALADRLRDDELHDDLSELGGVTLREVELGVPKRNDGSHDALVHRPQLVVRRADPVTEQHLVNRVALTRGLGMVVDYWHLPNLRIGARPFHAVLKCGEAVSDAEARLEAEQFLRIAEPPSHDMWKVTPDMAAVFRPGGGARLEDMREQIRVALRDLVAPGSSSNDEGPDALKRLLTIKVAASKTGDPHVTKLDGEVEDDTWTLRATVTAGTKDGLSWRFIPVVRTAVEGGARARVAISAVDANKNCSVAGDGTITMHSGKRQCTFRLEVRTDSLPGRPEDVALDVDLTSRRTVGP